MPAFPIQFLKKIVWSFLSENVLCLSDIVWNFLRPVLNLREMSVLVGLLEQTNSQFLCEIAFLAAKNTVRLSRLAPQA